MEIYSKEYLNKLSEEHRFVIASINKLKQDVYYARTYGQQSVVNTINKLVEQRIELEAKIEVLTEFLD